MSLSNCLGALIVSKYDSLRIAHPLPPPNYAGGKLTMEREIPTTHIRPPPPPLLAHHPNHLIIEDKPLGRI